MIDTLRNHWANPDYRKRVLRAQRRAAKRPESRQRKSEAGKRRSLKQASELAEQKAELHRLRALSASSPSGVVSISKKIRGRKHGLVLEKTRHRISLAGYYLLRGYGPYEMAAYIYHCQDSDDIEKARKATYDLFARHRNKIDEEKIRLASLRKDDQEREAKRLKENLKLV